MKSLLLILTFALIAQPVQAGYCAMMDYDNSVDSAVSAPEEPGNHDCCDSDMQDTETECGSMMNCGQCFLSVPAIPSVSRLPELRFQAPDWAIAAGSLLPSHSMPPFRPPII